MDYKESDNFQPSTVLRPDLCSGKDGAPDSSETRNLIGVCAVLQKYPNHIETRVSRTDSDVEQCDRVKEGVRISRSLFPPKRLLRLRDLDKNVAGALVRHI